jgi:hypothetical protein
MWETLDIRGHKRCDGGHKNALSRLLALWPARRVKIQAHDFTLLANPAARKFLAGCAYGRGPKLSLLSLLEKPYDETRCGARSRRNGHRNDRMSYQLA